MFNVGVIGTGTWGKNHVRIFSELGNVNLVGISDKGSSNFEQLSSTYKLNTTTDYNDLLKDETIDAVSICTPASAHFEVVKAALEAGKHVLVEKPITLTSKEGTELVRIAKENNKILMVGHIFRFNPAVNRVRDEIKKNSFGKIRFMYGSRMGLMTPRPDCGVMFDFALHDIDTVCYLLDKYPKSVTCVTSNYKANGDSDSLEDVGFITLDFGDNVIANIGVSWMTPKKVRDLWVIGEEKSASMDYLTQELNIYNKGIVPKYDSFGEFALVKQEGDDYAPFIPAREPLKEELSHFIDCAVNNKQPIVDGKVGVDMVKILEACYAAAREKKTKDIDYDE